MALSKRQSKILCPVLAKQVSELGVIIAGE